MLRPVFLTSLFASLLAGLLTRHRPARADIATPSADRAMAEVQAFYDKTPDLVAHFQQKISSDLYGPQPEADGTVYLKKGGKMLWDYVKPEKQQFISDGKMLWVYQPDDAQVIEQDLGKSALPAAVTFLTGTGNLASEFTGTVSRRSDGTLTLALTPKKPSGVLDHLTLVLDPSFAVEESIVYQTDGQTNDIRFQDVKTSVGLDDKRFAFTPPPGVTIIDPSKMGGPGAGAPGAPR